MPTFPNARYLFGKKEYDAWAAMKKDPDNHHDMRHIVDAVEPVMEAGLVDFIEPNAKLTDEVSLFPTPGHTPGHVSIKIVSKGQEAIITGDMMHHPLQLAEPDFANNFDMDKERALLTRKAFYASVADSDILVIGTHFCEPTSGYVVREGKSWKLKARAMNWDLKDQAVLITGAGRGLGRAAAELLAQSGAHVAVCDIDAATAAETAHAIGAAAKHYAFDVSDRAAFMAAAADFARAHGRIDAVVNNAMLLQYEPVENVTPETTRHHAGRRHQGRGVGRTGAARAYGQGTGRRHREHGLARRRKGLPQHLHLQLGQRRAGDADQGVGRRARPPQGAGERRGAGVGAHARRARV